MKEPVFTVGQTVRATGWYYMLLTKGELYTVTDYTPARRDPTFRWPPYVTVIGDMGLPVTGHTHRFEAVES